MFRQLINDKQHEKTRQEARERVKNFELKFQEFRTQIRRDSEVIDQISDGVNQIDIKAQDIYEKMCEKIQTETDEMAAKHA